MSEIKVGDRVKTEYGNSEGEVIALHGNDAWIYFRGEGHLTWTKDKLKKIEPFFERGHTYDNVQHPGVTFDCHYVGHVGASMDGRQYAAGVTHYSDGASHATIRNSMDSWVLG